jgi:Rrf2 family protein
LPAGPRPATIGGTGAVARPEKGMKLTSSCAHALRALAFLARHEGGGLVASHVIAAAEGLPALFLLKVLKPLASAGVLLSAKGPQGGYQLAQPARRITLLDVVEALDGPVRGEAPRWAAGAEGDRLNTRLQQACDAAAEAVRGRLRKVCIADLAVKGKG